MDLDRDEPSPTGQPTSNPLEEPLRRPSSAVTISNVLVILPSITRGFQPKNYNPPAYQNIGRSPSLPVNDIFNAPRNQSPAGKLSRSRMSIAYGHAASQQYSGSRSQVAGSELDANSQLDSPHEMTGSVSPYAASSGHLSPAARKEITAQLSVPITPNSLPSDARRQSISTLLPAGIMSAKLSQLILEEEEANQRELDAIMEKETSRASGTTPDPMVTTTGLSEAIPENVPDLEKTLTSLKPRPFGLSRSTSTSEHSPSGFGQSVTSRPGKRVRGRPQTSAAALSSSADSPPAFGARSVRPQALTSLETNPVPSPLERKLDQKRSRAIGTGKPGWEGDEVVNILREDGIQGKQACPRALIGSNHRYNYSVYAPDSVSSRSIYQSHP